VKNKSTLVIYEGNGYRIHGYDGIDAVVTTDIKTYRITAAEKKNVLLFFPPFDRSLFSWQGYSEEQTLGCYIIRYRENFPNDAYLADIIAQRAAGMRIKTIFNKDVRHERLTDLFKKSMATLHIKSLEGYGFSIIESLACGRPVILHEPFSAGKTYRFWCREGESALYFNSLEECMAKITRLSLDAEFRHELQRKSADTVMRMIDFQEQAENLRNFFEMIASVKTGKGKRPFSYAAPPYPEYVPSLSEKIEVLNLYSDIAAKAIKRKSGAASVLIHTGARFIKRYIVKGGFLKGYEGLKESVLNAFAVFLKYAKNKERTN
jgi:hypothetical protein